MSWYYPNNRKLTEEDVESYAHACYDLILALTDNDSHRKMYDPLTIEDKLAHSYVFELNDGGRHHKFKNLESLKDTILKETIERIKTYGKEEN